jgi:HTH-type transcriptional regulator/antitoxin HigA
VKSRPIRTDKDHREALADIDKLWSGESEPEGDKLDVLVTLLETYEERRWPLRSRRRFDPGRAALRDRGTRSHSG